MIPKKIIVYFIQETLLSVVCFTTANYIEIANITKMNYVKQASNIS